jgi:hypothetical protein
MILPATAASTPIRSPAGCSKWRETMSYEAGKPGTAVKRLTLTVPELASILGVGPNTVIELARAQLLPNFKVGKTYWFPVRRLAELYPKFFNGDVAA